MMGKGRRKTPNLVFFYHFYLENPSVASRRWHRKCCFLMYFKIEKLFLPSFLPSWIVDSFQPWHDSGYGGRPTDRPVGPLQRHRWRQWRPLRWERGFECLFLLTRLNDADLVPFSFFHQRLQLELAAAAAAFGISPNQVVMQRLHSIIACRHPLLWHLLKNSSLP